MRVQARREQRLGAPGDPPAMRDRFPARGRAVVHRGVGDVAAEQPRDLGLELEQHLQRALGDLGLVGRVGWSGTRRAGSGDRRSPGRGGDRRRSRGRTARRRRPGSCRASAAMCRSTAISLACIGRPAIGPVEPRRVGHVGEQVVDRRGADRLAASSLRSARTAADNASIRLSHREAEPDIVGDPAAVRLLRPARAAPRPPRRRRRSPSGTSRASINPARNVLTQRRRRGQRRRAIDQLGIDLGEAGQRVDVRRTPRRRHTSCGSLGRHDSRARSARRAARAQRRRYCPRRPSHRRSGRRLQRREDAARRPPPGRASSAGRRSRRPRRTGRSVERAPGRRRRRRRAPRPRRLDHLRRGSRPITRAPLRRSAAVSAPSPQPSRGSARRAAASSSASAAPPSAGTNAAFFA